MDFWQRFSFFERVRAGYIPIAIRRAPFPAAQETTVSVGGSFGAAAANTDGAVFREAHWKRFKLQETTRLRFT